MLTSGFKRGRDPTDDFALQLGQLAAPKLPVGAGGGYGGYGPGGVMSNGGVGAGLSPNNNNDTNEISKKVKMDHHLHLSGGGDVGGGEEDGGGGDGYTRVVHIRNVPNTVTETEIIQVSVELYNG